MQDLRVSIVQTNLYWENADKNLAHFDSKLSSLKGNTDLIVLPEMFNTGFSMNPEKYAESIDGKTINWLKGKAKELNSCIVGSMIIKESGKFYNRLIFMRQDGSFEQYNKRHLFRLANENELYTEGEKKIIVNILGWKICPLICYDLRFPVWSKNSYTPASAYEYDCLIYVANWPMRRKFAWESLLVARAIENQAYVIGVNRIGDDGNSIPHSGNSKVLDFKGYSLFDIQENEEFIKTFELSKSKLTEFRDQFTVGLDWDHFEIKA